MESKPWWQSKTVWFNFPSGSLDLLQTLGGFGVIPPGVLTMGTAVGNVLLRIVTSQPLSWQADSGTLANK